MTEKLIILFLALAVVVFWRLAKDASRDLDQALEMLDRWHVGHEEARRWLAEFPDVATALDHLKAKADGTGGTDISRTRDAMRRRSEPHKLSDHAYQVIYGRHEQVQQAISRGTRLTDRRIPL